MKKITVSVLFFAALAAALLLLVGCFDDTPTPSTGLFGKTGVTIDVDPVDPVDPGSSDGSENDLSKYRYEDGVYIYYYDVLTDIEKEIYGMIDFAVKTDEAKVVDCVEYTVDDYLNSSERAFSAYFYDHAEIFDYGRGWYQEYSDTQYMILPMKYDYWEYSVSLDSAKREFEDAIQRAVDAVNAAASTNYEKVIALHDYLACHCYYDYDSLNDVMNNPTSFNWSSELIFTAYGCLVNERCVCAGYAKAFKLICDRLRIPCAYITGNAGENHAWNRVVLGDESYYLDLTWDDSVDVFEQDGAKYINREAFTYVYCNVTEAELKKDHFTIDFPQPPCTATKFSFVLRNGLLVDEYDEGKLLGIVDKQRSKGAATVVLKDPANVERAATYVNEHAGELSWLYAYRVNYSPVDPGWVCVVYDEVE